MNFDAARRMALNLLARREHSRRELAVKLAQRDLSEQQIAEVLDQCVAENLQSDARFTESYVRMRVARGYGPARIRVELQQKGVVKDLIEEYLTDSTIDWYSELVLVWQKKFGGEVPTDPKLQIQQMRFLQYRGFSSEQINRLFAV